MRTGTDRLDACPLPVEAVVARLMAWQRPIADLVPGVASCWETHIEVFELLCAALFILRRGSALPPGDCTRRGCQAIVDALVQAANASVAFIIDKNGQLIAAGGDAAHIDTTSLASLTAGNIAATGGMAKLLRENEFNTQFHEGENANIHIQLVDNRVILVVIFDKKTSLGLVRLRVKKASEQLGSIFKELAAKSAGPGGAMFTEISDDDIDNLFND